MNLGLITWGSIEDLQNISKSVCFSGQITFSVISESSTAQTMLNPIFLNTDSRSKILKDVLSKI